jgi:hypothetical protein
MLLAHDQNITTSEWLFAIGLTLGAAFAGIVLACAINFFFFRHDWVTEHNGLQKRCLHCGKTKIASGE